ncbi:FecR family protein [Phenylobacterium deserti]|uniref:Iron dicitrate transport regulator FecR n=1 Tax=Phenylobacterium deserti TaxID=1914756 RepID=A0A328AIJ7_9CAUL|nr:FecR domain-containing protein [Phenylobacterium deserti]RAK52668.1 iron dicitrate transport regulator FecR [Phenylobacterium deserti]
MRWRRKTAAAPCEPAAEWFARCDAGALSDEQQAELADWTRSPENARALHEVEAAWADLKAAAADPDLLTLRAQALQTASGVDRRRLMAGLAGAGAAAGAGGGALVFATAAAATISTGAGERLVAPLPDGSSVTLAPLSRLKLDFGGERRQVRLMAGQAWFEARHLAGAPFVVVAGEGAARCPGGRFQVTLGPGGPEVLSETASLSVTIRRGAAPLRVTGGEVLTGPARLRKLGPTEVERATAWREGLLVFDDWPLGEVAAAFNRYSADRLVVADAAAATRVSGAFRYEGARDFAQALSSLGLQVRQVDTALWRVEPPPGGRVEGGDAASMKFSRQDEASPAP